MAGLKRQVFVLLGFIGLVVPVLAQQASVASIVEQFYPPSLTAFPDEIGGRQQCFAVYDMDGLGSPRTIVAAYTNHTEGVIRVLRANAGSFDVIAEPHGVDLTGTWCEVILEDVDADGRREVRVDFSINGHGVSWLFEWDGQRLSNLTPITGIANGDLVDVENDGVKEIYVRPEYPRYPDEPLLPAVLYRLRGEQYVKDARLVGMWKFEHTTSGPETSTISVPRPLGARGPYVLRVVNGRPERKARVTRAQVWLNGREVLSPADFYRDVAVIERTVTLGAENELSVRFLGQPASEMLVVVESQRWTSR